MDKLKIIESLDEIKLKINKLMNEIKMSIASENAVMQHYGNYILEPKEKTTDIKVNETESKAEVISNKIQEDFIELQQLLNSSNWPESVLEFQIVNQSSEEEKMDRAEGIVDSILEEPVENKKVLDFGCGEGHVSKYLSKEKVKISVGYDITSTEKSKFNWNEKKDNLLLTTNFEKVKEESPYDIIILYDVIDHLEGDPSVVLGELKDLLSSEGKIYIRFHPWSSRHGGHLYRDINKAFVHLIFTEEELNSMGYKIEEPNLRIIFPINNYEEIIRKSKLKKISSNIERQKIESFFSSNDLIKNRIMKIFKSNNFPSFQMEQCFLDYVLTK